MQAAIFVWNRASILPDCAEDKTFLYVDGRVFKDSVSVIE